MTPARAYDTLSAFGYQVSKREYTTTVGADGKVVGTDAAGGHDARPRARR